MLFNVLILTNHSNLHNSDCIQNFKIKMLYHLTMTHFNFDFINVFNRKLKVYDIKNQLPLKHIQLFAFYIEM